MAAAFICNASARMAIKYNFIVTTYSSVCSAPYGRSELGKRSRTRQHGLWIHLERKKDQDTGAFACSLLSEE
jgi:hypothetical protein